MRFISSTLPIEPRDYVFYDAVFNFITIILKFALVNINKNDKMLCIKLVTRNFTRYEISASQINA